MESDNNNNNDNTELVDKTTRLFNEIDPYLQKADVPVIMLLAISIVKVGLSLIPINEREHALNQLIDYIQNDKYE